MRGHNTDGPLTLEKLLVSLQGGPGCFFSTAGTASSQPEAARRKPSPRGPSGDPFGEQSGEKTLTRCGGGSRPGPLWKESKLPLLRLLAFEQHTLASSSAFLLHFLFLFRKNHAFLLLRHQQLFAFSSPLIQAFSAGPVILTTIQTEALSRRVR